MPSHYLNQCWNVVNWTFRDKLQWNCNWNSNIFIEENVFENVIWKMASILSWPQFVKYPKWYCITKSPPLDSFKGYSSEGVVIMLTMGQTKSIHLKQWYTLWSCEKNVQKTLKLWMALCAFQQRVITYHTENTKSWIILCGLSWDEVIHYQPVMSALFWLRPVVVEGGGWGSKTF